MHVLYVCMHESLWRSKWSLCIRVCVRMWFLARARAEIGLPVGAVGRESGEVEGTLNNSTFLKLERRCLEVSLTELSCTKK